MMESFFATLKEEYVTDIYATAQGSVKVRFETVNPSILSLLAAATRRFSRSAEMLR